MNRKMLDVVLTANRLQALFDVADEALFQLCPSFEEWDRLIGYFEIMRDVMGSLKDKIDGLEEEEEAARLNVI